MINRRWRRSIVGVAVLSTVMFGIAACSSGGGSGSTATGNSSVAGKRVLLAPHQLDDFNIAETDWVKKLLEPKGVKVDIVNPNGSDSSLQNTLSTAESSKNYDVIVWEPIDTTTAPTTIKQIRNAGIPQIVNQGGPPATKSNPFTSVSQIWADQTRPLGVAAAQYIKAHPSLGAVPELAFISENPPGEIDAGRLQGFMQGLKSITPGSKVVYNQPAATSAVAENNVQDLINKGTKFNILMGVGGVYMTGAQAALKAAGLAKAVNKEPVNVYSVGIDATPDQLTCLWSETCNMMTSSYGGPKDGAELIVKQVLSLLEGKTTIHDAVNVNLGWQWMTPDCKSGRAGILEQDQGVQGLSIPKCSFTYTGDTKIDASINDKYPRHN